MITIKSKREIDLMSEAGRIVALAHEALGKAVRPGITTQELDRIAEEVIFSSGALPSFKGRAGIPGSKGFPAAICTSVNEEVVHGIPGPRILKEGDIVSMDIGACKDGYHGDSARTYPVGRVSAEALRLIKVTEESFYKGLEYAREGCRLSDISHAVQDHVESSGFSVVREYVGHGIGRELQEDPQIPNYGKPGYGPRLVSGMVLAVEPMVNAGTYKVKILPDKWTVVTEDGSLSAHYEHTIVITSGEPRILTKLG